MGKAYSVLILGASYGSLLAIKLLMAGHKVKLVCLPAEVELINAEGIRVRMPIRGREGANVALVAGGRTEVETDGPYGDEPCVYQELARLPSFDGNYAVVGSWTVNGHACGLGIREDGGPVTRNTSRFVPHLFRP